MQFNSLHFALFLAVVFLAYWPLPHRFRWVLLLAASYYAYMSWNPALIVLILFTTGVSYGAALLVHRAATPGGKKLWLVLSLVCCLGVLVFFKYINLIIRTAVYTLNLVGLPMLPSYLDVLLPVGISFYTFQTLSYVIDVYRGSYAPERHFGYYALYVSFFPQLVAGPIERADRLLPQLRAERSFDYARAADGMRLMGWGFFKKLLIADILAPYVNVVYADPSRYTGMALLLATGFFSLQIYCDFSAYSDIAMGSAKLFGIDLMKNFKTPYLAHSIRGFWARWHISLSTFFRDYVYIPMGGSRKGTGRYVRNILVTFVLSGLWHGANYTFILWGLLHGLAQVAETLWHKLAGKRHPARPARAGRKVLGWVLVQAFVLFAWIFFRADNLAGVAHIVTHLFTGLGQGGFVSNGLLALDLSLVQLLTLLLPAAVLALYDIGEDTTGAAPAQSLAKRPAALRWGVYVAALVYSLLYLMKFSSFVAEEFLYFQF